MKKIYFYFFLFCLAGISSYAQPTIQQNDLPVAGLAFTMGTDATFSMAIPAGGANQNWDMSSLNNLLTDTSGFISAAGTPYATTFNTANLTSYDDDNNSYTYFTSNSNGFFINGLGAPNRNLILNPPQCFIPVPFTYNDQFTSTARNSEDTIYTDSTGTTYQVTNIITIVSHFEADGYGTLTLPNGILNNTLRVKVTETTYDSLYALVGPLQILLNSSASQKTHFRWFKPGNQAAYVLGIDADSLGINANYSEYLLASVILNTTENSEAELPFLYPVPANDQLYFHGMPSLDKIELRVYTLSGQLVYKSDIKSGSSTGIDVSAFENGVYFLRLKNEEAEYVKKFIVVH